MTLRLGSHILTLLKDKVKEQQQSGLPTNPLFSFQVRELAANTTINKRDVVGKFLTRKVLKGKE